jgi:FHA domain-containing protein/type VI secretion system protein
MPLTLRIQSYRKQPPTQPVERRFDQLGGTIGRAAGNDLELPDPGKYISRNHSKIDFIDGRYVLMDLGSNPSWINDRPVGSGKSANLEHGDRLLIGDYVLEVEVDQGAGAAVLVPVFSPETSDALPFQPQPVVPLSPHSGPSFDEMRDTLANARILEATGGFDPLAPLAARGPAPAAFDPLGLGAPPTPVAPTLGAPSANDPLGLGLVPPASHVPPPPLAFRGSEADHAPPQFMPMAAAQMPPPAPVITPAAPPPAMLIPDDYDPLADFLPPRVQPAAPSAHAPMGSAWPGAAAQAPAAQGWPVPPAAALSHGLPAQPPVHAAPVPAMQAAVAAGQGEHAMLVAMLRGLGLPNLVPTKPPLETAELAGAMLREAVAGTMAVLLARAMTKRESRLEMTVLGAQANNPLKFFPDAESALSQMLTNAMQGYMPPVKSIGSAFEDLKAHELAVIAGMRAALAGVLARFNPALIEARIEGGGVMDKMLSANRKARMWDAMVELYDDIQREAQDDFQHLFGEKFSAAYEDQIGRLHQK